MSSWPAAAAGAAAATTARGRGQGRGGHLALLAEHSTIESAPALAAEQSLLPVCSKFVADDAAPCLALPGDP